MPLIASSHPFWKLSLFIPLLLISINLRAADGPVSLSEDQNSFTLANGLVTARVAKHSGDLISLRYDGRELLTAGSGHAFGYWSQDASRGHPVARITIDPQTNGGERAEVSVKAVYIPGLADEATGRLGRGPACDVEIRYALERGLAGVYAYSILAHQTNYPATGIGEARFAAKLNPAIFNYLNVDAQRRRVMPAPEDWLAGTELNFAEARRLNTGIYQGQVEHKYDYSANQFDTRAYGWLGTNSHLGLWFINPSVEYLSGGPTKYELTGHLDISARASPVLLNYWRSSHYGGAVCPLAAGEAWSKVIGPFLIYCNSATTPDAMWQDALTQAGKEIGAWPYDWVSGVDYPHQNDRGTVKGRLVLNDPAAPHQRLSHLLVGLTAPDYVATVSRRRFGGFGPAGGGEDEEIRPTEGRPAGRFVSGPRTVDWQHDAKHYEFWVRGDDDGHFEIPNVRPGNYVLNAIADGVLGGFTLTNVTVAPGQILDLETLDWRVTRYGRQLWDIGIPNRSGSEFFKGDDYYHWGWYLQYPKLFPDDVHYVIGQSDFHRDWFFEQVPHNENPDNTNGRGRGRSTPWSISFNLPEPPHGRATLRLAICGSATSGITVTVNGRVAGVVQAPPYNATINRDGIAGSWSECDLAFDASWMKAGENVMTLTVPAGSLTSGIIYDYLRLELDESAPAPKPTN
jgi:rhamnogalacturonan endolyase